MEKPRETKLRVQPPAKLVIDVYDILQDRDECALIICQPTGVYYTAQCGGMACTHPVAEGFFLPIWDIAPGVDDHEFGCSNLTKSPMHDRPDLREKLAAAIDEALREFNQRYGIQLYFDRERIDELQEGWWPLIITGHFGNVGPLSHRCYYHAGNCD